MSFLHTLMMSIEGLKWLIIFIYCDTMSVNAFNRYKFNRLFDGK